MLSIQNITLPALAQEERVYMLCPVMAMSLKAAGDRGPSGQAGVSLHQEVARETPWPRQAVFSLRQTHSMRVLVLKAGSPAVFHQAEWIDQELTASSTVLQDFLVPDLVDPQSPLAFDLAARVGLLEGDGILTDLPVLLGVTVADCMPIALNFGAWRGLLHSGWQGTGIVKVALTALVSLTSPGSDQQKGYLVLGPSIAATDYPVDQERASLFASRFGAQAVMDHPSGTGALDLGAANIGMVESFLAESEAHRRLLDFELSRSVDSTFSHGSLHSYRRDGKDFGRMLVLLGTGK